MVNKKIFKELIREKAVEAAGRWKEREPVREKTSTVKGATEQEEKIAARRVDTHLKRESNRRAVSPELTRPLVFPERVIKGNDLKELPPNELARLAGKPIARIQTVPATGFLPEGIATGFMIAPNLLLTNHHVFPDRDSARDCAANFLYERNMGGVNAGVPFFIDPGKFFFADEKLDLAIVYVEPVSLDTKFSLSAFGFLRMIKTSGKILVGQSINIIQHPSGRLKHYAYQNNTVVDILSLEEFIHYTTDTEKGSSGSPCYNNAWELVALHHSGVPLVVNNRIVNVDGQPWDMDNQDEDEIQWIANEGISISCIVALLEKTQMGTAEQQSMLAALLRTTNDPLLGTVPANTLTETTIARQTTAGNLTSKNTTMSSIVMNITGPTNIYIGNLPGGETAASLLTGPAPVVTAPVSLVEKKQNFDTDYDNRPGFDPNFLTGLSFELPEVIASRADEMFLNFSTSQPYVVKYHHYSLAMNKKRRLCMWTASNIDYNPGKKSARAREEFGSEDWRPDPRIPTKYQLVDEEFYKPAKLIDRGHIVRRADNCWGDSELEIEYANADSYHWTNCTQQHQSFNRDAFGEKGLWGMLENHIEAELTLADGRAILFAGPVLDNANDPVVTINDQEIRYPLRFWKIIVAIDEAEGLISYGFILSQEDVVTAQGIGVERLDFSAFHGQQATIRAITDLTGVSFDAQLYDTDVLKDAGLGDEGLRPFKNVKEILVKRI
jgi:endonuclease G